MISLLTPGLFVCRAMRLDNVFQTTATLTTSMRGTTPMQQSMHDANPNAHDFTSANLRVRVELNYERAQNA